MNVYQLLSCDFHDTKFNTKMWGKLPKDILQIILCYHGAIADRNGRFMDRIYKYDPRYMVLSTIPRIEIISPNDITPTEKKNGTNNFLKKKIIAHSSVGQGVNDLLEAGLPFDGFLVIFTTFSAVGNFCCSRLYLSGRSFVSI